VSCLRLGFAGFAVALLFATACHDRVTPAAAHDQATPTATPPIAQKTAPPAPSPPASQPAPVAGAAATGDQAQKRAEHVTSGDDPYEAPFFDDRNRADTLAQHESRGLLDRILGAQSDHLLGHHPFDRGLLGIQQDICYRARIDGGCFGNGGAGAAEIAIGYDTHQTAIYHDRKLIDAILLEYRPRSRDRVERLDDVHWKLHPVFNTHPVYLLVRKQRYGRQSLGYRGASEKMNS